MYAAQRNAGPHNIYNSFFCMIPTTSLSHHSANYEGLMRLSKLPLCNLDCTGPVTDRCWILNAAICSLVYGDLGSSVLGSRCCSSPGMALDIFAQGPWMDLGACRRSSTCMLTRRQTCTACETAK